MIDSAWGANYGTLSLHVQLDWRVILPLCELTQKTAPRLDPVCSASRKKENQSEKNVKKNVQTQHEIAQQGAI